MKKNWIISLCCGVFFTVYGQVPVRDGNATIKQFRSTPSFFIPNSLNAKTGKRLAPNSDVAAFIQTRQGRVVFTADGAYVGMSAQGKDVVGKRPTGEPKTVVLKAGFSLDRARKRGIRPQLQEATECRMNFFLGKQEDWQKGLPSYRKLVYANVWDGVTLEYLGYMDRLEYRLLVNGNGDPNEIQMETGADRLELNADGSLSAFLSGGELRLSKPYAYQVIQDEARQVSVAYRILTDGQFGFEIGDYDRKYPLVIDPTLTWSTYLGGVGLVDGEPERVSGVAVDGDGNAYITGSTSTVSFPTTTGAYSETSPGGFSDFGFPDVFAAKLNSDGTGLVYSTYLGGSGAEHGEDITVNASGEAYITGDTRSSNFPTTSGAFDESLNGSTDIFIAKINADGSDLVFSTVIGGSSSERGNGIALDSSDNVYVAGDTSSSDFPTTAGAWDESQNGRRDVVVCKLKADGTALLFSTFLGGSMFDNGTDIALDGFAEVYVTGSTNGSDFPATVGAFDETHNGNYDAFAAKLSGDGSTLLYATFLGDALADEGYAVAVDGMGNAYLTGSTLSPAFPTSAGAFDETHNGDFDGFAVKLNADGSGLLYATLLGGSGTDYGLDIAVDGVGAAYLTGTAFAGDFPTTDGVFDNGTDGNTDVFIIKLDATGANLVYSTFLGGAMAEQGHALALNASNQVFVVGYTASTDFPTSGNAFDRIFNGPREGFAARLSEDGASLLYSTLIGGSGSSDYAGGMAMDPSGGIYLTGSTDASAFPVTTGAFAETHNGGGSDVFIVKLNDTGAGLSYASFLGGSFNDVGLSVAVDGAGNAYLTGYTRSEDFPVTESAFKPTFSGGLTEGFAAKLSPTGESLIYATFLGGSGQEEGKDIAVDSHGNAFIVGVTGSSDFPTSEGAFDPTFNGESDGFVTKLNSDGSALEFSTLLGGMGSDTCWAVALDHAGNAYLSGGTFSSDFPTTAGSYDETYSGGFDSDAFVVKLNSSGEGLHFSTYLGGGSMDVGLDIAVDAAGNAHVVGQTYSFDFPVTGNAVGPAQNGSSDGFAVRLNQTGDSLLYSTYLGGESSDSAAAVALDTYGNMYITGTTGSSDFPTTSDAFDAEFSSQDAFLVKLSKSGGQLYYATYLGGRFYEDGKDIACNDAGGVFIYGETLSDDLPTTEGAFEPSGILGDPQTFVARFDLCDLEPLKADITPVNGMSLGLTPPFFDVDVACAGSGSVISWDTQPATSQVLTGTGVVLDPPPSLTTVVTVTLSDGSRDMVTSQAVLLVPLDEQFLDYNADGCNNLEDLWALAGHWLSSETPDANGDGVINLLDMLYINTADPTPCP